MSRKTRTKERILSKRKAEHIIETVENFRLYKQELLDYLLSMEGTPRDSDVDEIERIVKRGLELCQYETYLLVRCDCCDETYGDGDIKHGWKYKEGEDYCPDCLGELPKP